MRIGVDIDGTICDFQYAQNRLLANVCNQHPKPVNSYDWYTQYQGGETAWNQFWHDSTLGLHDKWWQNLKPTTELADEVLCDAFESYGDDLTFITYRPSYLEDVTHDWLWCNQFAGQSTATGEWDLWHVAGDSKSVVPCDVYLDDMPSVILDMQARGIPAILMVQPWNIQQWATGAFKLAAHNWHEAEMLLNQIRRQVNG